MRRPGEVLSRFALIEQVWDESYEHRSNVVDAYVAPAARQDRPPVRHPLDRDGARRRATGCALPERILSALPLRVRLTLGYTGAIAVVLAIVCALPVPAHQGGHRPGHRRRAGAAGARRRRGRAQRRPRRPARTPALPGGQIGDIAQVLDARGRVVAATPSARRALLSADELRAAQSRRDRARPRREPARARRAGRDGPPCGRACGADLPQREHALDVLTGALLIGGPLALALAALAGYALASGALRPVEAMRSRAATISAADPDARLPLPEARDEIRRLGTTLNEMLARLAHARARSAPSSPTPATSCARRSPSSRASSSSPRPATPIARSCGAWCARPPRRPTASSRSRRSF